MTTDTGLVKQTTGWVYLLFAKYMRGRTLGVQCCGTYGGRTNPTWLQSTKSVGWLDVSAAVEDGWVNLAVVNLCAERGWETEIKGVPEGREVQVYLVTGEGLGDVNTEEETSMEVKESTWVAEERFTFLKHSFTMLRWRL